MKKATELIRPRESGMFDVHIDVHNGFDAKFK